jgi:IrrE N-terminal-like domain
VDDSSKDMTLATVATRLNRDPDFLAAWLDAAPDRGDSLAHRLGLEARRRALLALCRPPRQDQFAADVAAIGQHLGVDVGQLAAGLRETAALTGLAAAGVVAVADLDERPGPLAAAHDQAEEQVGVETAVSVRLREQAAAFWAGAPERTRQQRDIEAAIAWSAPLAVVALPNLDAQRARHWLAERSVQLGDGDDGRPLRGLLLAARGVGVVFLDGTLQHAERRFTLAHELGHFLLDYLEARQRVLREAPSLLEVVDGWRPPTRTERAQAVLARIPIGLHAHLLERDVHGGATSDIEAAEDTASQFALEVLAPWSAALDTAQTLLGDRRSPYVELLAELTDHLAERFVLPSNRAAIRAAAALEALGVRRGFFDR